jgi:hypothetical protein
MENATFPWLLPTKLTDIFWHCELSKWTYFLSSLTSVEFILLHVRNLYGWTAYTVQRSFVVFVGGPKKTGGYGNTIDEGAIKRVFLRTTETERWIRQRYIMVSLYYYRTSDERGRTLLLENAL